MDVSNCFPQRNFHVCRFEMLLVQQRYPHENPGLLTWGQPHVCGGTSGSMFNDFQGKVSLGGGDVTYEAKENKQISHQLAL